MTRASHAAANAAGSDLTGQNRFVWNVAASWAGHLVFIAAGFIMPRQIDQHVGQVGLGTWDFGWTAVNYFFLAQVGVGAAVNRYVAKHRASDDIDGLTRVVSAAMLLQIGASLTVLGLTAASARWLPRLFARQLGDDAFVASSVIALLGTSIAVRMAFQVFNGVVTGCHRWDLHNLLNSGAYAVTVVAMFMTLHYGGGLIAISRVYLAGAVVNEVARAFLAYYVCPELRISPRMVRWADARTLLVFGAKLSSIDAVNIIASQLTGMLVLQHIGVATLAVYARLSALTRQTEMIVYKFSLPLTPTVSSLQGSGRSAEVPELYTTGTRLAAYLVWPMLITLAFIGDAVLQLWMGPRYDRHAVLAVMAVGAMFPFSQQPLEMILVGLNLHGRFAAVSIVLAVLGLAGSAIGLRWFQWDLIGLAVMSLLVANAEVLWIAVHTCRRLAIPAKKYFVDAYGGPLASNLPFAAALALLRLMLPNYPMLLVALTGPVAVVVLGPTYWRRVASTAQREQLKRLSGRLAAMRFAPAPGPTV